MDALLDEQLTPFQYLTPALLVLPGAPRLSIAHGVGVGGLESPAQNPPPQKGGGHAMASHGNHKLDRLRLSWYKVRFTCTVQGVGTIFWGR